MFRCCDCKSDCKPENAPVSNTELVKFFDKVTRWRNPATILTQHTKAGKEQYVAFLGYDAERKPVRRSLGLDKDAAYAELAKVNQLIAEREFKDAPNVFDIATSYEVKAALTKLEGHGASLAQAVDFFLQHHRPTKGHLTVEDASRVYVESLKRLGRSDAYVRQYEKAYLPHFCSEYGKKRLVDITQDDAENFIYKVKESLSSYTKGEYIGKLRVFFNAMGEMGFYQKDLNPFAKLKKPQATRDEIAITERERCLPLDDVHSFLDYLSKNGLWDILAVHAAIMFCGARKDEIQRLNWNTILVERGVIDLTERAAKKRQRRILEMPDNARAIFAACKAAMGGEWQCRSENALKLKIKRIKKALRKQKLESGSEWNTFAFHQNFARVSFGSYHYALHGAKKTSEVMGNSEAILHRNYREVATKNDAELYFRVLPIGVKAVKKPEHQKIAVRSVKPEK